MSTAIHKEEIYNKDHRLCYLGELCATTKGAIYLLRRKDKNDGVWTATFPGLIETGLDEVSKQIYPNKDVNVIIEQIISFIEKHRVPYHQLNDDTTADKSSVITHTLLY